MSQIAAALNFTSGGVLICRNPRPSHCNLVDCNITTTGDRLRIGLQPCLPTPGINIVIANRSNISLTNVTVISTQLATLNVTNDTVQLNFVLSQHTDFLTMGISVSCSVSATPLA